MPDRESFRYTFENMTTIVEKLVANIGRFFSAQPMSMRQRDV